MAEKTGEVVTLAV